MTNTSDVITSQGNRLTAEGPLRLILQMYIPGHCRLIGSRRGHMTNTSDITSQGNRLTAAEGAITTNTSLHPRSNRLTAEGPRPNTSRYYIPGNRLTAAEGAITTNTSRYYIPGQRLHGSRGAIRLILRLSRIILRLWPHLRYRIMLCHLCQRLGHLIP